METARMKRKRVVFVVPTANTYGGENALLDLLLKLSPDIEPVVVAPSDGPLVRALTDAGIQTRVQRFAILDRRYFHPLRIFVYLGSAFISFFRLLGLFRALRPDIVHTNNVLILPAALASRALRIPHVWHVREIIQSYHINPLLWRIWRGIILGFSIRVICISTAVQKQFGDSKKVTVIHDGVDPDLFHPLRKKPSRSTHTKKVVRVGIVGRLEHRRKGQDLFIEAARIALKSREDLHFIIAGHEREGREEKERRLHEMVKEYGLQQKIEFRGFVPRERMPELMNELDVLVLSSKQPEGLGIVLLEAMACGKAVIAFSEGGPLDIIEDHENGLLVPPGDVPTLARAMLELADNPKLRKDLGTKGRKTVESFFRSELTAKKVSELYDEILSHTVQS
jgi:glycosyltransferase involved in cell wall biosynthesis